MRQNSPRAWRACSPSCSSTADQRRDRRNRPRPASLSAYRSMPSGQFARANRNLSSSRSAPTIIGRVEPDVQPSIDRTCRGHGAGRERAGTRATTLRPPPPEPDWVSRNDQVKASSAIHRPEDLWRRRRCRRGRPSAAPGAVTLVYGRTRLSDVVPLHRVCARPR